MSVIGGAETNAPADNCCRLRVVFRSAGLRLADPAPMLSSWCDMCIHDQASSTRVSVFSKIGIPPRVHIVASPFLLGRGLHARVVGVRWPPWSSGGSLSIPLKPWGPKKSLRAQTSFVERKRPPFPVCTGSSVPVEFEAREQWPLRYVGYREEGQEAFLGCLWKRFVLLFTKFGPITLSGLDGRGGWTSNFRRCRSFPVAFTQAHKLGQRSRYASPDRHTCFICCRSHEAQSWRRVCTLFFMWFWVGTGDLIVRAQQQDKPCSALVGAGFIV